MELEKMSGEQGEEEGERERREGLAMFLSLFLSARDHGECCFVLMQRSNGFTGDADAYLSREDTAVAGKGFHGYHNQYHTE
jgi:hypothetical protein